MSAAAINRLRAIAARLIERRDPDAAWFSAALSEYLAGARHGLTLGDAFGFRLGPGERPWWQVEACGRRDEILRDLAARHFPALRPRPAATALMQALGRYEANGWRSQRSNFSPPAGLAPLQVALFELLKIGAPISFATIRRALAHQMPVSVSHGSGDAAGWSEPRNRAKCEQR